MDLWIEFCRLPRNSFAVVIGISGLCVSPFQGSWPEIIPHGSGPEISSLKLAPSVDVISAPFLGLAHYWY